MSTTIYFVQGETGFKELATAWVVAVYADLDAAELHAQLANDYIDQEGCLRRFAADKQQTCDLCRQRSFHDKVKGIIANNLWDAQCKIHYSGVVYSVVRTVLIRHPDEYRDMSEGHLDT